MSALSRCSRFSSLLRRTNYCSSKTNVLSRSTWKTGVKDVPKPAKLLRSISHQPVLTRCYTVSAGKTVSAGEPVQEGLLTKEKHDAPHSENFPASQFWKMFEFKKILGKDYYFEAFCQRIYAQYYRRVDVPPITFYGCMSLVDNKMSFEPEEIRLLARSLGYWNKALSKDEKVQWMNYLSDRFFSLGVKVDEVYFNLILNNYLVHWIPFSPVDFLAKMEKHGVTPNGTTFERFVMAYCRNGDIKSASQVLEHMKACNYPISQRGYASLVYGNFIAGDKETAMKLFREAGQVGFETDTVLYSHVILGHAMMGDLEGVKQMVNECQEGIAMLPDSILCFLLERVSETGNKQMFDYFMGLITEEPGHYYNDVTNHLPTIMKQGNRDFAYQFFSGLLDPMAIIFYKSALLADLPINQVLHYASCLKADGVKHSALINYYSTAIRLKTYDKAVEVLPHLVAEGTAMRPQDLWPLIQYFRILKDLDGLKTIMPYIQCDMDTVSYYLNGAMQELGVDMQQYEQILKDYSKFTEGQLNACLLRYCSMTKGLEAAIELVKSFKTLEDNGMNTKYFKDHLREDNWEQICEAIFSSENGSMNEKEFVVKKVTSFGADIGKLKTLLLEKGVKLREVGISKALKETLSQEELKQITIPKVSIHEMIKQPYSKLQQLGDVMGNTFLYKLTMLNKSHDARDWPVFEKTLGLLDASTITDIRVRLKIADYYSRKPETIGKSMEMLNALKELRETKLSIPLHIMMSLVSNFCANGYHAEAVQLLEDCDLGLVNNQQKIVHLTRLFNMESTEENVELGRKLLYALKHSGSLPYVNNWWITQDYCKLVTNMNDSTAVCHEMEMLQRDFKFNDMVRIVLPTFCKVMATNDKVELQAAYDRFSQNVSEHTLLVYLAAAFMEAGHIDKARKVLSTSGLRLQINVAYSVANMWIYDGKFGLVEDFCKLAEYTPGSFTKLDTLFLQLKVMCSQPHPDVDACIQFYENKFDEEGVIPKPSHVEYFASFLKRQHRELPASVQAIRDQMENTKSSEGTKTAVRESTLKPKTVNTEEKQTAQHNQKTINEWLTMMREQPDIFEDKLKSKLNEVSMGTKIRLLTAAVENGDIERGIQIKKIVFPEENGSTIVKVAVKLQSGNSREKVDTWLNFVEIIDDKITAIRAAITITGKYSNYDAMEKVYGVAQEQGLTMEKLAEKVKGDVSDGVFIRFISDIRLVENKCKKEKRQLVWEPTSTWTLELPTTEQTSRRKIGKEQTTTVSSETIDTNTANVTMDHSTEVIHDTAVDINVDKEADIGTQDTATMIKDTESTNSNK